MKIAIVAAMDKELNLLLELMNDYDKGEIWGQPVYRGQIGAHDIVLSKCGIGKVNSAMRTMRLIEEYSPELVINSGVAGGADISMPVGSILCADAAAYHDVWCGPGTEPGEADGFPLKFLPYGKGLHIIEEVKSIVPGLCTGLIATGDKFVATAEEVADIKRIYPEAKACDMESASIAHACQASGVPFMVVRVVSDTPGSGDNLSQYENFWSEAPAKTFHVIEELLLRLD